MKLATYVRKLKDRSGNYVVPTTRSSCVYFDDNTTLTKLSFYPVGSIYQSTGSTSPASLFGGNWERIQGRFLLGTSSSYSVTDTGGEESHTLTAWEIPKSLPVPYATETGGSISCFEKNAIDLTAKSTKTGWVNVNNVGVRSHNNMPPYYAVNIWRRTA